MGFVEFILFAGAFMVLVAAVALCTKCFGNRSGEVVITSTSPANTTTKKGEKNTAVVVDTD